MEIDCERCGDSVEKKGLCTSCKTELTNEYEVFD